MLTLKSKIPAKHYYLSLSLANIYIILQQNTILLFDRFLEILEYVTIVNEKICTVSTML